MVIVLRAKPKTKQERYEKGSKWGGRFKGDASPSWASTEAKNAVLLSKKDTAIRLKIVRLKKKLAKGETETSSGKSVESEIEKFSKARVVLNKAAKVARKVAKEQGYTITAGGVIKKHPPGAKTETKPEQAGGQVTTGKKSVDKAATIQKVTKESLYGTAKELKLPAFMDNALPATRLAAKLSSAASGYVAKETAVLSGLRKMKEATKASDNPDKDTLLDNIDRQIEATEVKISTAQEMYDKYNTRLNQKGYNVYPGKTDIIKLSKAQMKKMGIKEPEPPEPKTPEPPKPKSPEPEPPKPKPVPKFVDFPDIEAESAAKINPGLLTYAFGTKYFGTDYATAIDTQKLQNGKKLYFNAKVPDAIAEYMTQTPLSPTIIKAGVFAIKQRDAIEKDLEMQQEGIDHLYDQLYKAKSPDESESLRLHILTSSLAKSAIQNEYDMKQAEAEAASLIMYSNGFSLSLLSGSSAGTVTPRVGKDGKLVTSTLDTARYQAVTVHIANLRGAREVIKAKSAEIDFDEAVMLWNKKIIGDEDVNKAYFAYKGAKSMADQAIEQAHLNGMHILPDGSVVPWDRDNHKIEPTLDNPLKPLPPIDTGVGAGNLTERERFVAQNPLPGLKLKDSNTPVSTVVSDVPGRDHVIQMADGTEVSFRNIRGDSNYNSDNMPGQEAVGEFVKNNPDVAEAVSGYTGSLSTPVNSVLRWKALGISDAQILHDNDSLPKVAKFKPSFVADGLKKLKEKINNIAKATGHTALQENTVVYRRLGDGDPLENVIDKLEPGDDILYEGGFFSTTTNHTEEVNSGLMLHVLLPAGSKGYFVNQATETTQGGSVKHLSSQFASEEEFLLHPGSRFRLLKKDGAGTAVIGLVGQEEWEDLT